MAKLIIMCFLLAAAVVCLVFSGYFLVKLAIESAREKKANKPQADDAQAAEEKKEEVEEIDLDAMLATLEKRAQEGEKEEEPAKEEKKEEKVAPVVIVMNQPAPAEDDKGDLDYEQRLAQAKDAYAKVEKDYGKNTKAINKYKRTERQKERNEKLLNKKAGELASLNLAIYNVKDLKDVDPEKKAKQEELTTHIAELKAAIVEADEYLTANKEKYAHDVKMNAYLEKEHARYEEEIKKLEEFLKKGEE